MYVNPYLVLRSGGYTKHFYIEGQRVTSKLGSGNGADSKDKKAGGDKVNYPGKREQVQEGIVRNLKFLGQDGTILTAGKSGKIPPGQILDGNKGGGGGSTGGDSDKENFMYYFHPDHLGSSSYITDASGEVYQHLEYFAFGETFVEEHSNTHRTPYLFNGKELDEETGLYYYGARYYDARTSVWLAVDPLAEKMPGWSPYNYTFNNPIIYIDPDGAYPFTFYVRSFERSEVFGFPFTSLGDGRPHTVNLDASARIHYKMKIETSSNTITSSEAWSSRTVQLHYPVAPLFNPQTDEAIPRWSDGEYKTYGEKTPSYWFKYSASEPIMSKLPLVGGMTPNIDASGYFNVHEKDGMLNVTGKIRGDGFPDAETFVRDNAGNSIMLGKYEHGSLGSPVWSLFGNGQKEMININVQIELNAKGNFHKAWSIDEKGNRTRLKIVAPD